MGGFFDTIGGSWGSLVTTTLVARGDHPRFSIGSVNFSEFFVTFAEYWQIILGLLIGGVIATPLTAYMARKLPVKALMILVGLLIILLSIRTIYLSLV